MHSKITDPEMKRRFSARRLERVVEEIGKKIADIDFFVKENFGWRGGGVLAWSGMRGVVTVAAAQSLPDSTPFRPQIVLIAFVVARAALLVARSSGRYTSRVLGRAQRILDLREASLQQIADSDES
jgi:monovalent cation/hydrogen antiporter